MVSRYGAQILTHVDTVYLLLCDVVGVEDPRIKVANDRGWHILGSTSREGGNRPCVGRDLTVTLVLGTSRQRRSHVAVGSSLA